MVPFNWEVTVQHQRFELERAVRHAARSEWDWPAPEDTELVPRRIDVFWSFLRRVLTPSKMQSVPVD
jgi:hypothetical protein